VDKRYGILILSVTILVLCSVGTASTTTWYVDDDGGADFTRIQDAINNASIGDTILVYSGVYYEHVAVDKSVTLKGIGYPVVDTGEKGNVIAHLCADGITLVGFTATNSGRMVDDIGIMVTSNNNTITGNNFGNNCGIGLFYSRNNTITGNTFVNGGLYVSSSYQNTVNDNTVNGKPLVYLEDASGYKLEDAGQVILVNCNNITVKNLDISNTNIGIELWETKDSIISHNTLGNNDAGISLDSSSNNIIRGNNVSNNNYGGITLDDSSNNTITGNNANINLAISSNNIIRGNTFVNGGLYGGLYVFSSYQNTVKDNTVNGKPLVYLEDASDYKVEDAGQVILVNCNNITVENLDLSNTIVGIDLWHTEDSKILNTVSNDNYEGIRLSYSSNNDITGNNVSNNNVYGIGLYHSSNNNNIYLNNFMDNVDSSESTNIWNSPQEITYTYNRKTYTDYKMIIP
jgi:parallel beta-helix repeat protein